MRTRNVLCGCWLAAFGLLAPPLAAMELQPGLLLGDDRVWLMAEDGGVACVSADDGREIWHSRDIALPVGLSDGQLLALGETAESGLTYAWVDASDGKGVARGTVALPDGVRGLIDERLGESFAIDANEDGFEWRYHRSEIRGTPSESDESVSKRNDNIDIRGAFRIDWIERAVIETQVDATKTASQPAEIGAPSPTGPRTFRSKSDAFRLVSERQDNGRYRWTISSVEGQTLGSIDSDYSYRPFEVVAGRLFFVTPLSMRRGSAEVDLSMPALVAYELASGERLWQRELRDTRYRGPYPP